MFEIFKRSVSPPPNGSSHPPKATASGPLVINGHTLLPMKNGWYRVRIAQLGRTDLSTLPSGTTLVLEDAYGRPSKQEVVGVFSVWIVPGGNATVVGLHRRRYDSWKDALRIEKYMQIADRLLRKTAAKTGELRIWRKPPMKEGEASIFMELYVKAAPFADMERQVRAIVQPALRPLFKFQARTNAKCKKQFGV
jgi:hypothetical protein